MTKRKTPQKAAKNFVAAGNGGEPHQSSAPDDLPITTNHGVPVSDNQNSLKAGRRGPTLLEDMILREKIQHFDHERIPERIVHARGSGAHGYFELTESLAKFTDAKILTEVGERTEVFARFSTVAGGAGSVDTPRDVRGFAVKFYTSEGNWDLVGNNIPVFFIQDAIKFPDLIHAVKMEADRGYPQAASAHDTAEAEGASVKIVAPKIGGVTLRDGTTLKADGQLAGTPSVLFDAVAIIISADGCAELMKDGAATDFAKNAFGHLKAIGYNNDALPLLERSGIAVDDAVVDLKSGVDRFVEHAKTRLWAREPNVRTLA